MPKTPPDSLGEISSDQQVLKEFRDTLQVLLDDIYDTLHDSDEGRNHSEEEVVTDSTWINGKPIYRKVLTLTTASGPTARTWLETTDSQFSWGTTDVDEIIRSYITARDTTNSKDIIIPFTDGTDVTHYEHDFINFGFRSIVTGSPTYVGVTQLRAIMEYTKTTDTI